MRRTRTYRPEKHPVVERLRAAGCEGHPWAVYWCIRNHAAEIDVVVAERGIDFAEAAEIVIPPIYAVERAARIARAQARDAEQVDRPVPAPR